MADEPITDIDATLDSIIPDGEPDAEDVAVDSTEVNEEPDTQVDDDTTGDDVGEQAEEPTEESDGEPKEESETDDDEEDPLDDLDDEIKPDREDDKELHFRKPKAVRLLQAHRDMNAIRDAIPNASVETLKEHFTSHTNITQMHNDVASGEPEGAARFTEYWFGKGAPAQAVAQMVSRLPDVLRTHHPEAMGIIQSGVSEGIFSHIEQNSRAGQPISEIEKRAYGGLVDRLWADAINAAQTATSEALQEDAQTRAAVAMRVQQAITGGFESVEQAASRLQQAQRQPADRTSQERAALQREKQEFEQSQRRAAAERSKAWMAETDSHVDQAVSSLMDKTLEKFSSKFSPKILGAIKRDLADIVAKTEAANREWEGHYNAQREAAKRRPDAEARTRLAAMKTQFVEPILRKNLRAVIAEYTQAAVSEATKTHDKHRRVANKRESASSGEPTSRVLDASKLINSGKPIDEIVNELLA